jgi:hypothetical protein
MATRAYTYIYTCSLIWPTGVAKYKDALSLIQRYLRRIDLWMIGRTCTLLKLPVAPLSAAQLAHFDVALPDYFPLAMQANDIAAMEWLFDRGLFDKYDCVIPMSLETYKWVNSRNILVKNPRSLYTVIAYPSYNDLLFMCLRDDVLQIYHSIDESMRYHLVTTACVLGSPTCMDMIRYHYSHPAESHSHAGLNMHPDVADVLQSIRPDISYANVQKFHTRTAKRIHASRPRRSDQWMHALTWDKDAPEFMDTLPISSEYIPRHDRAIQWLIRHGIKFDELNAIPYWHNPPLRLFRYGIKQELAKGYSRRARHGAIHHLCLTREGHAMLARCIDSKIHLQFARADILGLCARADGALMSRIVPVFTKSHLVAALRAGNIPFLRWLVGIACQLGIEYCVKHVMHKRTWIWLRDNVPLRPHLIMIKKDLIDQHLRNQLRADGVTIFHYGLKP